MTYDIEDVEVDQETGEVTAVAVAPRPPATLTLDTRGILTRGTRLRRSVAIVGYGGVNGSFKTCTMVRDTLPSLALGRRVLSTVAILDPFTGNPHPLYAPFTNWGQLHDFRDGDILLDEVTGIMDARDQGMPKHVRRLLPQMRRRNVLIRWTGISWDNSDKRLRQITRAYARCRGMWAKRRGGDVDTLDMWAPNRLSYITTFDAQTMTTAEESAQFTEDMQKKRRARVLHREFWWGPGSLAFRAYDTLADVYGIGNDCPVCGGKRMDRICKDPEGHDPRWAALTAAAGALA